MSLCLWMWAGGAELGAGPGGEQGQAEELVPGAWKQEVNRKDRLKQGGVNQNKNSYAHWWLISIWWRNGVFFPVGTGGLYM